MEIYYAGMNLKMTMRGIERKAVCGDLVCVTVEDPLMHTTSTFDITESVLYAAEEIRKMLLGHQERRELISKEPRDWFTAPSE